MADAGRVIAGSARGIRLLAPGAGTRPFGDRVKQTLFAILEPDLPGASVLDLFAGSGAAGIEALSRGAAAATFVERDATAVRTIGENLRRAHLDGRATVVRADVLRWIAGRAGPSDNEATDAGPGAAHGGPRATDGEPPVTGPAGPYDLVFVDPPYADEAVLRATLERLGALVGSGLLASDVRVVVKHFWRSEQPPVVGLLASDRARRFGETALTFYRPEEGR